MRAAPLRSPASGTRRDVKSSRRRALDA